jgi:hypothetical protein
MGYPRVYFHEQAIIAQAPVVPHNIAGARDALPYSQIQMDKKRLEFWGTFGFGKVKG